MLTKVLLCVPDKSKVPARPGSKARTGFSGRLVQPGSGPDPSDGQISFLDVWGKEKGTRAPSICRPPWRILSLIREKFSHHCSLSRTPSIFSPYCSCSRACLFKSAVASQLSPGCRLLLLVSAFLPPQNASAQRLAPLCPELPSSTHNPPAYCLFSPAPFRPLFLQPATCSSPPISFQALKLAPDRAPARRTSRRPPTHRQIRPKFPIHTDRQRQTTTH